MSAASLETALRARGVACRVEDRERLALLIPEGSVAAIEDPSVRREIVSLLREHGFTHLALEVSDAPSGDAAVHRD